jgi:DNA-binding transcriptional LysR family regulator
MMKSIHLARIDLNLLVLFDVVFEEGHVGRAAERLNLTASAVSHGLTRLRRMLNDPLFLRTPKGVVPTARAIELAQPIADILARAQSIVAAAEPFDATKSRRHFTIGAPDALAAVFLLPLLAVLRDKAPGITLSARQVLPELRRPVGDAWEPALTGLDARTFDVAVVPVREVPARFAGQLLYEEDFVVASRAAHPFARKPNLERFCAARHLVVSLAGDPHGFVDDVLARKNLTRHVALTVPNFSMALALVAETDMIAALPRQLVTRYARRFGIVATDAPIILRRDPISVVATRAAMMDAGVAWLFDRLAEVARANGRVPKLLRARNRR